MTEDKPSKPQQKETIEPYGMQAWIDRYLEWMSEQNYSKYSVSNHQSYLKLFKSWCDARDIRKPREVNKAILERYRHHLFHHRKPDGKPLSFQAQHSRLIPLRSFFKWLSQQNVILFNPAAELQLPKLEKQLPQHALTPHEVEKLLGEPKVNEVLGLRDRAMMETLYSTGIRALELIHLSLYDLSNEKGTLKVRLGKGKKDRFVPIGERAIQWIVKYLDDSRPMLVLDSDEETLFLSAKGKAMTRNHLTKLVGRYMRTSGVAKSGACHLLRHAMATSMLENGADIRLIQQMLGHEKLNTTEVYTHVSIGHLKRVHEKTHPAEKKQKPEQ